ncbi:hypothetical protein E2C01_098072 [Portunus trituberculatus]|uniref:Uncharacterized protein n=1 Tax=Portunus trituberculatus TaxID=210409 RepID=A0A5B7KD27_PORTR|nr:hypothetical protein [Portunus trituberculatus]
MTVTAENSCHGSLHCLLRPLFVHENKRHNHNLCRHRRQLQPCVLRSADVCLSKNRETGTSVEDSDPGEQSQKE